MNITLGQADKLFAAAITFPVSVPLKNKEIKSDGAIGVSGSSVENDHAVANRGAEAFRLKYFEKTIFLLIRLAISKIL